MSRAHLQAKTSPPSRPQSNRAIWLGVVVVGLVALGVAIALSGGGDDPGTPADAQVSITGAPLPSFAGDPFNDPAVGLPVPILSGYDFAGQPASIDDDGRPKVILFLAHWCPHCQAEVPVLQAYQDETGFPPTFDMYSVATSYSPSQPNWPPSAWLEREGWSFPVLVDDPDASAFTAFGHGGFPYYVLVGADGTVALRLSGELGAEALIATMEQITGA